MIRMMMIHYSDCDGGAHLSITDDLSCTQMTVPAPPALSYLVVTCSHIAWSQAGITDPTLHHEYEFPL